MKNVKFLWIVCVLFFIVTGCKKEETTDSNAEVLTVDETGKVNVGADSDGAFYSYLVKTIYEDPDENETDDLVFAWIGDPLICLNAGEVEVNDIQLFNSFSGGEWYSIFGTDIIGDGSSVNWKIEGSALVNGFSHVDNSPMPKDALFTIPSKINISQALTIKHSDTKSKGVVYIASGSKGISTKFVLGNSTSYTFSPQELNNAAYENDYVFISVQAISYEEQKINGKSYYFVKMNQIQKETATL